MHPGKVKTLMMIVLMISASASVLLIMETAGTELSIVVTDSMDGEPTGYPIRSIPEGSLIVAEKSPSVIQVGDVIGYHTPLIDGTVYHRVVSIDDETITVKGDNLDLEETIPIHDILGRVFFVNEPLGHIISFVKGNVIPLLTILLGAYLLLSEERSYDKGREREEK
ncbi:MAG: S26 family signal peptidase [Candidatus Methanomethylophilaceae archaeon]|nr:S26 family signal peptidase [Candidatus Methanomethylophilaceae archaeon]